MEAKSLQVFPELNGVTSREDSEEIKREASLKRIREVDAPIVLYTDGSAHGGTHVGGAAVVVTEATLRTQQC